MAGDTIHFVRAFLRHPRWVGAVLPSSRSLARVMTGNLQLADGESVVELGPGTGPFTAQIRRIVPTRSAYLGIERDPVLVERLRKRFPDLKFITGLAEQVADHHQEAKMGPTRAIICGLPFASLPLATQDAIIDSLEDLVPPGGLFRTFQYVHAYFLPAAVRFRRRMNRTFGPHHRSPAVLANLPPAYVLTWSRKTAGASSPNGS